MCCLTFFCSHKFHRIENYSIFEELQKKANWARIIVLYTQIMAQSSEKYGFGIRDPRAKKAPSPDPGTLFLFDMPDSYKYNYCIY
jgi:hypothetical protein